MATTVIYKCDKCGKEQTTNEQFWTVGVVYANNRYTSTPNLSPDKKLEVCRPCLESFGINVVPEKGKEPVPPPTVEELIREIIARCTE